MASGKIYTKAEQIKWWLDIAEEWRRDAREAWHKALRIEKEAEMWKRKAKDYLEEARWYRDNAYHVK